uniref:Aquaporin 7 n=1 Tax=Acanthochromis polyacanthus TaxID=80966 RepID=A0A3Q1EBT8_9TELE
MKDLAQSVELGVSQRRGVYVTRPKVWVKNELVRVGLAETLCTYVMMTFGLGSVAQVVTGQGAFGQYFSINVGFGLGVAMGFHVGGKVSGAHMNGAVSFTMCVFGRLAWKMLPLYIFAQLLGSFLAAGTIYGIYYEAIHDYCDGNLTVTGAKATAGIFATYPAPYLSLMAGFADQVAMKLDLRITATNHHHLTHSLLTLFLCCSVLHMVILSLHWCLCCVCQVFGTAMLLLCLMALSDQKNKPAAAGSEPAAVGLLVVLIGISLGSNSGYAINPTRDIAPRIFTAIAGWGTDVFRAGNGWWWVPLVATPIGGVLGAGIYKVFVELHHPPHSEQAEGSAEESIPLEKNQNISVNSRSASEGALGREKNDTGWRSGHSLATLLTIIHPKGTHSSEEKRHAGLY